MTTSLTIQKTTTIGADQTLTFTYSDPPGGVGIDMMPDFNNGLVGFDLINYGHIIVNVSSATYGGIAGVVADGDSFWTGSIIDNYGSIEVSGNAQTYASGIGEESWGPSIHNEATGQILVTTGMRAVGIDAGAGTVGLATNPVFVVNNEGLIRATSTLRAATGVYLWGNDDQVINSGTIEAVGTTSAGGVVAPIYSGLLLNNSGTIRAYAGTSPGYGVVCFGNPGPEEINVIVNDGTIEGTISIFEGDNPSNPAGPNNEITHVTNNGQMIGDVLLRRGNDLLVNNGTITGNVFLGTQNDTYVSQAGTVTGTINGGLGNDSICLGGQLSAGTHIDGSWGTDTLQLDGDYASGVTFADSTIMNVETLKLTGPYSYRITLAGETAGVGKAFTVDGSTLGAPNTVSIDASHNDSAQLVMTGGTGADYLRAGDGAFTVEMPAATTFLHLRNNTLVLCLTNDLSRVAYSTTAALVSGDTNGTSDIYLEDLTTHQVMRLTPNNPVLSPYNVSRFEGFEFSPDGSKILFASTLQNLVSGDSNQRCDLFTQDVATGQIIKIVSGVGGAQLDGDALFASYSPDGSKVIFYSEADNLVSGDTNHVADTFVLDVATGAVTRASVSAAGVQFTAPSNPSDSAISPDDKLVAFATPASNLIPGTMFGTDIAAKNLLTGAVTRITAGSGDPFGAMDSFGWFSFSPDSTKIAFGAGLDGQAGSPEVYLRDLITGSLALISCDRYGTPANGSCANPLFSPDGTKVAFMSIATNLSYDTDVAVAVYRVYLKDLMSGVVTLVSVRPDGTPINGNASLIAFTDAGIAISVAGDQDDEDLPIPDGVYTISLKNVAGGDDSLNGKAGDDTLIGGGGNDSLDGSNGTDTASYAYATGSVSVDLALTGPQAVGGGQGTDTLANIENLTGSGFADTLHDNTGSNVLTGLGGNDVLDIGRGGNDSALGGDGNDTILVGSQLNSGDRIDGGAGTDRVVLDGQYDGTINIKAGMFQSIETLSLTPGFSYRMTIDDTVVAAGQTFTVDGSQLGDTDTFTLDASKESDGVVTVIGGRGNDQVTAGAATLMFSGGNGNDQLNGSASFKTADSFDGGRGTDTLSLNGDYSTGLVFGSTTVMNVETIKLSTAHSYHLTLNDGNVAVGKVLTIDASKLGATDQLQLDGSAEQDGALKVIGGAGVDAIVGSAGADEIVGGLGSDFLTGGGGADRFTYKTRAESTGVGFDTLIGFDFASDHINVRTAVDAIDAAMTGALSLASFDSDLATVLTAEHLGKHHAVLVTASSGDLGGQTFLIVDLNGKPGYQSGGDLVLHLQDPANLAGFDTTDFV